jgi:GNAT superfamily N-acetyltransferase
VTGPALGLEFRDMTEADLEQGLALSRSAGWNQTLEDWRLLLSLGPGLFRVARRGSEVVASGGAVCYGGALAWICMILVAPAERGRGLGTLIFDDVLDRVRPLAGDGRLRAVGLDATPAGRGLYLQRGFADGPALVRLRVEPGATTRHPSARTPLAAAELDRVLEQDRSAFGADRSAVLRTLAASAPELASVVRAGDRVRAYCFGRHGDHADQLGPVVADDAALAHALVLSVLATPRHRPLILDARAEPRWLAALGELGFREARPLVRMYLGPARPPARPELEPVILGPEFG